jgi:hypothetical protein
MGKALLGSDTVREAEFDEIVFFDRLHQTFLLLNQVALPAYLEHFSGEPDKLTIVQYYMDRLAEVLKGESIDNESSSRLVDGSLEADTPRCVWMRAALAELRAGRTGSAEHHLSILGAEPQAELRRLDGSAAASTARCPLYDPELLAAHCRLWQLKTGRQATAAPSNVMQSLTKQHVAIQTMRRQPGESDLSLRKFLDKHRRLVWELGWAYRCRGLELVADATAARTCFLRAWTIGDALFPVSERGRIDRFDPIFLAELGDVYARLGRYDLMLRYIYCDGGLPGRHEMARPVADLARVAESVRLVHADESSELPLEKELPETVSQILFEQPVASQPNPVTSQATPRVQSHGLSLGWILVTAGGCLVCGAIAWRIVRLARRSEGRVNLHS